jgi:hypothetical protein
LNQYNKSFINILPASSNSIFCYFSFSSSFIKAFEERTEVNTWSTSKTLLKLFYIENGVPFEKQSILTDGLADNWYITLHDNDIDLFVEIGKLTMENVYIPILTSNILSMPRTNPMNSTNIYMIDINNSNCSTCMNPSACREDNPENRMNGIDELCSSSSSNSCSTTADSKSESKSKNNCIHNYIYSTEFLNTDTQLQNYKKVEEYLNRKHWELPSSK